MRSTGCTSKNDIGHSVIHETLVDVLDIQKEIHRGILAVMDDIRSRDLGHGASAAFDRSGAN